MMLGSAPELLGQVRKQDSTMKRMYPGKNVFTVL